jgi:hypothetical protein
LEPYSVDRTENKISFGGGTAIYMLRGTDPNQLILNARVGYKKRKIVEDFLKLVGVEDYEFFEDSRNVEDRIPLRKPGRPHWPEDDWARKEVNIKGRNSKEVYLDWLKKFSEGRDISNPKDSFRKVINPKRGKKRN